MPSSPALAGSGRANRMAGGVDAWTLQAPEITPGVPVIQ